MTQSEQFQLVQNAIRSALQSFVGKPPDRQELAAFLHANLSSLPGSEVAKADTFALANLMAMEWLPYEDRSRHDIKKMVRALDDRTVDWLVDLLHGDIIGMSSLIYLEQMYRRDQLGGDWELEQTRTGINATYTLKKAVDYVRLDFVMQPGIA